MGQLLRQIAMPGEGALKFPCFIVAPGSLLVARGFRTLLVALMCAIIEQ